MSKPNCCVVSGLAQGPSAVPDGCQLLTSKTFWLSWAQAMEPVSADPLRAQLRALRGCCEEHTSRAPGLGHPRGHSSASTSAPCTVQSGSFSSLCCSESAQGGKSEQWAPGPASCPGGAWQGRPGDSVSREQMTQQTSGEGP